MLHTSPLHTSLSRLVPLAAGTAVSTGIGMIPVHRLPRTVQIAYIVLPAAVGAGVTAVALRRALSRVEESGADPARRRRRRRVTLVGPVVVGGIIAGSTAASIRIDRSVEELLRRRGVPAPRLVMGLASGALTLAVEVLGDRRSGSEELTSAQNASGPTTPRR